MAEFKIIVDDALTSKWDSIVEELATGTVFHRIEWLRIVEKHTKDRLYPAVVLNGNEVVALMPIFVREKRYLKTVLPKLLESPRSGSMVPYLGPLFPHIDEYKQDKRESILNGFQEALNGFTDALNVGCVRVVFSPGFLDVRQFQWNGFNVKPLYTYMDQLPNIQAVWDGLKKTLRKNILNAQKEGVTITQGSRDDIDYVYSSVLGRIKEQGGTVPMPKQYFYDLYDAFYPKNLRVFLAEYNNEKVGGVIVLLHRGRVSVWFGAVHAELSGLYPNDLLHWTVMKWAGEHGFNEFEICGADMPTISSFKARYNLALQLHFSATKYRGSLIKYAMKADAWVSSRRSTTNLSSISAAEKP